MTEIISRRVNITRKQNIIAPALFCALVLTTSVAQSADLMPSWNAGKTKQAILNFVSKVTKKGAPEFVPPAERIVTFDNDGTLWVEQPLYFQLQFPVDRVKQLAPAHPEWKEKEPFKSVLAGDLKTAFAGGHRSLIDIVGAGSSNMTPEEFDRIVKTWMATAKHPKTGRLYPEMIYQPMLELLGYLRANGFKTFIVSGGGVDFMRVFSERVYSIRPSKSSAAAASSSSSCATANRCS